MACDHNLIGSLKVGVTDFNILNAHVNCNIPSHIEGLPINTYYIDGEFNKIQKYWVIIAIHTNNASPIHLFAQFKYLHVSNFHPVNTFITTII